MVFVDVLFPLKLRPLTYRCDTPLSHDLKPGIVVSAPLKKSLAKGIVIGESSVIPEGDVKEIKEIYDRQPLLSTNMLKLLKWMSEYYIAEEGLVLKSMLSKEAFKGVKKRNSEKLATTSHELDLCEVDKTHVQKVLHSIEKKLYKTFLLHAPSLIYEYSFLFEVLKKTNNIIILLPELCLVDNFYQFLTCTFGQRVALYHSDLSSGKRYEAIRKILEGRSDIVVGTRSAVFAPLREVSFIAVLHEHNDSYKHVGSPCYNARDVAIMRGFFEKIPVLLSSVCPSVNSFFNCHLGKYSLLTPSNNDIKPKVKIIDMRYEKKIKPYLSKKVIDSLKKSINSENNALIIMNRRGYSTLQCFDCNHIEECPNCKIPIIFHKHDMVLKCHYCNYISKSVTDRCSRCKSFNLRMLGAGTQKLQEDLEEILGVKILRFDSDKIRKKADLRDFLVDIFNRSKKVIFGTNVITKRMQRWSRFAMAAILNSDLSLGMPDFRSAERSFQELMLLKNIIEEDGNILIQTRMAEHYLYKCLKNYDYYSFIKEELMRRKSLHYPPFFRLIVIKIVGKDRLSEKISAAFNIVDKNVEVLGPSSSRLQKNRWEYKVLLKSNSREKLHIEANKIIEIFKKIKSLKFKVDVDPVKI